MRGLKFFAVAALLLAMSSGIGACSNMTYQQQWALSGGALGAGGLTTDRQLHVGN